MSENQIGKENGGQVGAPSKQYGKPNDRSFERRVGNPPGGKDLGDYKKAK